MNYQGSPRKFKSEVLQELNFEALSESKNELEPRSRNVDEEEIYEAICQRIDEKLAHYKRLFELAAEAGIQVIIHIKSKLN